MRKIFTIITVVYNGEKSIEKTLKSVLDQDNSLFQYIVIDGKSKDKTMYIVSRYKSIDIVISDKDKGVYDAMNKGIELATGEWILFMNSGDTFANKDTLKEVFQLIDDKTEIIYGDTIGIISRNKYYLKANPLGSILNRGMPFCHQSVFVRTGILLQNKFNLKYKILSDFDMFRKFYMLGFTFKHINIPISIYDYEGGFSFNNPLLCFKEKSEIIGLVNNKIEFRIRYLFLKIKIVIMKMLPDFFKETYRKIKYKKYYINE